jgi:hypothetical protein
MQEPDGVRLGQLLEMHARHPTMRLPAVDFLLDAFLPKGIQCPSKYEKNPTYQSMWDALMRALASEGREVQSLGMVKCMKEQAKSDPDINSLLPWYFSH